MKCPKCGKGFTEKPAVSRINNDLICPLCGQKEALDDAIAAGAISEEDSKEILKVLKSINK